MRYDKRTRQYGTSLNLKTFTATDEYLPDARAAVQLLAGRTDVDASRIFVLGHSLGGTFALDGDGPPNPDEYATPGHVGETIIADIAEWITTPK
ncbi:MAG: hypothetical protein H0U92_01685 [Actinobacteria bacterium]|nr:hypothetical protein [Actinomycetota bacterium]